MTAVRAATFLNVDLELRGERPVPALLTEARRRLAVLHEGGPFLFGAELAVHPASPDKAAAGLAAFVEALPAAARAEWDGCSGRTMNAGFECTGEPAPAEFALSAETVAALARIGAGFAITIYAAPPAEGYSTSAP